MNTPPALPGSAALPAASKTPGLAIASLVLGIFSFLGCALLILPPILAVIFGHISVSRSSKDPAVGGKGLAIAGLVLGYVSFLSIGLLAAMAVPAFQKVREVSLEKAMMNDARQIGAASNLVLVENNNKPVTFTIDANGKVSGPLATYVTKLTPGISAVDNVIENDRDGFSLRHPHVRRGATVEFDAEGRERGTHRREL
jgi:hypothetical protein